jgi:acyl dehydratase
LSDSVTHIVTQETIDAYGRINGDNDIIHYDDAYARARGFRGTLAHGMMVMAYGAEMGARKFGEDWLRRGRLDVTWTAPVCPTDRVTLTETDGRVEGSVQTHGLVMVGELGLGHRPSDG